MGTNGKGAALAVPSLANKAPGLQPLRDALLQALKRSTFFDGLLARLEVVPFPVAWRGRFGRRLFVVPAAVALLGLSACRQDMHDQPRFKPLAKSDFYADMRSERPPVADTVARGQLHDDTYFYTGKVGNTPGDYMPFPVTAKDLARGRERFNIYCAPCHSRLGDGNGMIPSRGFKRPPSFHDERLRKAPLGYFFDVATNGFGVMPDYASQIPAEDRWRIVAYIRALQLSQDATRADVPGGTEFPSKAPHFKEEGSGATLPVVETRPEGPAEHE